MLLVCRFVPAEAEREAFLARARRAVALLAAQPGCEGVDLGRAIEEPGHWVLVARFTTVTAYRRALQPFEVREHVVPLLSEALPEPSTFETLASAVDGRVTVRPSLRSEG